LTALFIYGCAENTKSEKGKLVYVDDLQREVHLDSIPNRIVSLTPSFTEILYAIGADAKLVGVSSYCNFPAASKSKVRVGSVLDPSAEAITALDPELVFLTAEGNSETIYHQLERIGITTFVSNPRSFNDVLRCIESLGAICAREKEAQSLIDSLHGISAAVAGDSTTDGPAVLLILSSEPLIAAGPETFIGEMIQRAGGTCAVQDGTVRYPVISRESILKSKPDIILIPDDMNLSIEHVSATFPEWQHLPAIIHNQVFIVESDLYMRPGPRLWQGLLEMHSFVNRWEQKRQP
jgi:ABC-type Fe3+-hydroxamate transport system substrate-binding protein